MTAAHYAPYQFHLIIGRNVFTACIFIIVSVHRINIFRIVNWVKGVLFWWLASWLDWILRNVGWVLQSFWSYKHLCCVDRYGYVIILLLWLYVLLGVSHSDVSCVLDRIHSDVSSNIQKNVYHIVKDNFVTLLHISKSMD